MRSLFAFLAALVLAWPVALYAAVSSIPGRNVESSTRVTTIQIPISPIVQAQIVEVMPSKHITTSSSVAMPTRAAKPDDPCDRECTKLDFNPICASNGQCQHEFPNECIMATFNCRHPSMSFTMIASEPCDDNHHHHHRLDDHQKEQRQHSILERCTPEDLMGFMSVG